MRRPVLGGPGSHRRVRACALLVALPLLVSACGGGSDDEDPAPSATTSASASTGATSTAAAGGGDLADVTVGGAEGKKPTLTFAKPFSAGATVRRVLTTGKGDPVATGQRVTVEYLGINGTDGKEFDTSFGRSPATFVLNPGTVIAGFEKGLKGARVGSRVLIAIPPADGYGTQGVPASGIGPTDTLLFVVDIKSAASVLARATGKAVAPKAGLPKVKLGKKGKPSISIPSGKAPSKLVVQDLIQGRGAPVKEGQTITVHYTGVIWGSGKQFDSSWDRNQPAQFQIGAGKVIRGWDQGLVGQHVGSQVLLVVPPDDGYGANGNSSAGIKGTDVLVFVVDILDAA